MPFTIPSGIITTQVSTLERIAKLIPELGVLTTKTITLEPLEGNREPILAKIYLSESLPNFSLGFVNAVGLENPGAEEFARMLKSSRFPSNKFLLASIGGKSKEEFLEIVEILEDCVDGFELNLSCPTKIGYCASLVKSKEKIVYEITKSNVKITKKPIFVKLGYENIVALAKEALEAGAYGISAINTISNYFEEIDNYPILSNKYGGISGNIIKPIALRSIRLIRCELGENFKIIGIGGIRNANDIKNFALAGANIFGIGSALEGLKESELREYFSLLIYDLENETNHAEQLLKNADMRYKKVEVVEKIKFAEDGVIIKFNIDVEALPGQFVFLWIPGFGEKPFSVVDKNPLTLAIMKRGILTTKILELEKGDNVYIRGPYGNGIELDKMKESKEFVLVAGGVGIAGIYLIAKDLNENGIKPLIIIGAKDRKHLILLDELKKFGDVFVATEDGSLGFKGMVTDLFEEIKESIKKGCYFFNCGRKEMIEALLPKEMEITEKERIYFSFDHITKCGIGLCGRCASENGLRTCIEGPFISAKYFGK